jgi:histidine ammonia-lyase
VTIAPARGVTIGTGPLSVADLVRIARGARVDLTPEALDRIAASRAVVDAHVDGEALIYGLNTGLGHLRDVRVPREQLRAYQHDIVLGHDGGVGDPLPTEVVRAAMGARLNGIARGGSGASPGLASGIAALLNAGVHPVVPTTGSVGAADLMHMAAIAAVLIGAGRAEVGGEVMEGAEALARAGLEPVTLEPKDGLTLVSANGVSIGHAALVVDRASRLARLADLVVAVSLEAVGGNASTLDPVVLAAKPVAGQAASGAAIRGFLGGGGLLEPGSARSVQDPLSFRVAPQVHGAFRAFVDLLAVHAALELNASDDNPLVDPASGRMLSNGNFHPMALALAADALRPAIAHVGQLADRRLSHLWAGIGEAFLDPELGRLLAERGGILLRYAAASLVSELRAAAGPVTLDVAPLDVGVEDHATNAPLAVRRSDEALGIAEHVLAIELLVADDRLAIAPPERPIGAGVAAARAELEDARRALGPGPRGAALHAVTVAALPAILAAAEAAAEVAPSVDAPGA